MLDIKNIQKRLSPRQKRLLVLTFEFIKLQLAGNIPFWGTYGINFVLDQGLNVAPFQSLLVATVLAYALFFVVADRWVFSNSRSKRNATTGVWRFVVFMSITALLTFNITWQLHQLLGISVYIGQFISAGLSIAWTFVGLRFWVFAPARAKKQHSRRPMTKKLTARR